MMIMIGEIAIIISIREALFFSLGRYQFISDSVKAFPATYFDAAYGTV